MQSIKIDVNLKTLRIGSLKRDAKMAKEGRPKRMEIAMINGLDDVVVAETVLSDVDGQAGKLVIRGHSLDELVANATYEEAVTLLWEGFFDEATELNRLSERLGTARHAAFLHLSAVDERLLRQPLFDVVRALVARIEDGSDLRNALLLVAAPAVFTPAVIRLQRGLQPTGRAQRPTPRRRPRPGPRHVGRHRQPGPGGKLVGRGSRPRRSFDGLRAPDLSCA